jgi:hypothetical protein
MIRRFSLLSSIFSIRNIVRRSKETIKHRQHKFLQDSVLDLLEERQLLATFSYSSNLLTIQTDNDNEAFTIKADSSSGNYTLTTSGTFSGNDGTGLTGNTTSTLTIGSDIGTLTNILIQNNAANSGSSLSFLNSGGNSFSNSLTVNFTNLTTGTINVANAVSLIGGASLSLKTSSSAITVSSPISADSSGSITFQSRNIEVTGNISTSAGDIALYGNGGGVYQAGTFDGVCISGAGVNVNTTGGNITIDGRAGGGSINAGVNLTSSRVLAGGAGCLSITGMSGN